MRGKPCTTCHLAAVAAINAEILSGRPIRAIAAEFSVGYGALYSHARNHVSRVGKPSRPAVESGPGPAAVPDAEPQGAVEPLAELVNSLREHALQGDVGAAREYRLAIAALEARTSGSAAPAYSIREDPGWVAIRTALFLALRPFPDAQSAVRDALRLLDADADGLTPETQGDLPCPPSTN